MPTNTANVKQEGVSFSTRPYDMETRLLLLIDHVTTSKADWKGMERETGLPAERWRQFMRGSTKASVQMIEAVAQRWPQYAFWLATGVSDASHGHHAPNAELSFPALDHEPEGDVEHDVNFYEKTTEYFRLASKLSRLIWPHGDENEPFNGESGTDKLSKAKKANRRIEDDFRLLMTLGELKDREFAANNINKWTEQEIDVEPTPLDNLKNGDKKK